MKVYFINLDRHVRRRERMENLLGALAFERVPAVDGQTLSGPERRDLARPNGPDNLSRYELACFQSHRQAWMKFVADGASHACIMEDDLLLSPDFSRFINDPAWIPPHCDLVKIETFCDRIMLARNDVIAGDRKLMELRTFHRGTGGYILSRRGAEKLLAESVQPTLPVDHFLFARASLQRYRPVLQLIPALCVQSQRVPGSQVFDELASSIQPPEPINQPKTWTRRVRLELTRPFRQFRPLIDRLIFEWRHQARQQVIPFR